jgi:CDP-diacylglycerol---glycerol-3-phosphate 3-phosphatidyltransferase
MNDIYSVRVRSDDVLKKIVKPLFWLGLTPNLLTLLSFFFAILCGAFFASGNNWYSLPGAFLALIISSALDALDGPLARLTNSASKKGDFLDHTLDRFADVFIFGGVVLGGHSDLLLGMTTIIVILLVSYLGVQAQALGVRREYRGLIGRAYRLAFLMITTLLTVFYSEKIGFNSVRFDFLGWTMVFFLIAGIITVCQRWFYTWKVL